MTEATSESHPLTLHRLREANLRRVHHFDHGDLDAWTPERWAIALLGEVGELANEVKKLFRGDGSKQAAADELADVLIYHDLFCARLRAGPTDGPDTSFDHLATLVANRPDCPPTAEAATLALGIAIGQLCQALYANIESLVAPSALQVLCNTLALAAELGIDPDQAVITKFNATSRRIGSEVLL